MAALSGGSPLAGRSSALPGTDKVVDWLPGFRSSTEGDSLLPLSTIRKLPIEMPERRGILKITGDKILVLLKMPRRGYSPTTRLVREHSHGASPPPGALGPAIIREPRKIAGSLSNPGKTQIHTKPPRIGTRTPKRIPATRVLQWFLGEEAEPTKGAPD